MIPLRDSVRPRTLPFVNYFLILINIYVFIRQTMLPETVLETYFQTYGVIPSAITHFSPFQILAGNWQPFLPLITSIFIHGSLLHLGGNMLYLWVFGDNVEDRLGHFKYLLFYLVCGAAGSIAHIFANPLSQSPLIGASGAIAGVLGAYFIVFPHSKILTLVPIFIFITIIQVKAIYFLFLWFILQLINGLSVFRVNEAAQIVAWWAHIGGFLAGVILIKVLKARHFNSYLHN
ncbi:rhomboid family intramembrane serine protease [Bacillota bacterium LX-D]|nr:rhomboid family intramembrane serine protease [Bacillota bacterium LX-D]